MKKLMLVIAVMGLIGAGCGDDQTTQSGTVVGSAGTSTATSSEATEPVWLLNPGS